MTARSCRSGLPSSPAVSLSSAWAAMTEIEVKERKDRVDDALNATRAAVQEGIVVGGGVALMQAARACRPSRAQQRPGRRRDHRPPRVEAPLRQIAENAVVDGAVVAGKIRESSDKTFGFNAQTEEYGDMFKFGRDRPGQGRAHRAGRCGSVSGLLITTEAMVADRPKDDKAPAMPGGGGMGGMGDF